MSGSDSSPFEILSGTVSTRRVVRVSQRDYIRKSLALDQAQSDTYLLRTKLDKQKRKRLRAEAEMAEETARHKQCRSRLFSEQLENARLERLVTRLRDERDLVRAQQRAADVFERDGGAQAELFPE